MTALAPEVTVIVPTFGRPKILERTIGALLSQRGGHEFEVIVIDDGSPEPATAGLVSREDARLRCVRQDNAGPARARNHGARLARGQYLVFIDNDIETSPDFLERHVELLLRERGQWIVGRIDALPELRATPFGRFRAALSESFQGADESRDVDHLTAANVSMRRDEFMALDGFDERFRIASCEDADLAIRARRAGIRLRYEPSIRGLHLDWANTLDDFCERQRLYSVADVELFRKHGDLSPRARLVRANQASRFKALVNSALTRRTCRALAHHLERVAPDTAATRFFYRVCLALSIHQGVRQGWGAA
jgi:GT2 family glycosyltransferase